MHFYNQVQKVLIMKPAYSTLIAFPFMLLIGCGGQESQSIADGKAQLCTDLARLNTSVATPKSMSASSTVSNFMTARDDVKANFEQVKLTAQSVQAAKLGELETAYQNLDNAIQSISDTATLQQTIDSVAEQVAAVEAAREQMNADLSCP